MPKKDTGFSPLPEVLKPTHLRGHRVHLNKGDTDDQFLPNHPSAIDGGAFNIGRNNGVNYYRTMPYVPASLSDSKHDSRSRSESPRRARAARNKYWSFRHVHPESQQNRFHLDMNPPTDIFGRRRPWAQLMPVLPAEAPVVIPSKRQLYEQAQEWPRPPRRHFSERSRRGWTDSPRRDDQVVRAGGADDFSVNRSGKPKKSGRGCTTFNNTHTTVRDVCDSYGLINAGPLDLQHTFGMLSLDSEESAILERYYANASADARHDGSFDVPEDMYGQDGEVQYSRSQERDVDAMFELAQQKHALKMAAKRKRLQRQGWDVWDGDSILSPELEWENVDGEVAGDFELL